MPICLVVASDGTIYVGEGGGKRVRQVRDGVVTTLCQTGPECAEAVRGLLIDEAAGLLYMAAGKSMATVFIGTPAERCEARYYPALQTWSLMQDEQRASAVTLASAADESAQEARARRALRLLMDCPIPDILVRTLRFLCN